MTNSTPSGQLSMTTLRERPEDIAWHTGAIAGAESDGAPLILLKQSSESLIIMRPDFCAHREYLNVFSRVARR